MSAFAILVAKNRRLSILHRQPKQKVTRFEVFKGVITKLPPHLQPVPGGEPTHLVKAIGEQVNYATASTQFVGSDEEMLQKLESLVAELRRNGAEEAARQLIGAVKMRPHYLDSR